MYSTEADLLKNIDEETLIELTDDSSPPTAIDSDNVTEAIEDGDSIIDGYLRGKYTLPLASTPRLLKKISVDLAIYELYTRREDIEPPKSVITKQEQALKLLERIKKGTVILDVPDEENLIDIGAGEYKTNKTASDRIFTSELMRQFF